MTEKEKQPTIEEMQSQIAELSKVVEQQKAEIQSVKDSYAKSEKSLTEQRELNSKLLLQIPSASNGEPSAQDEEDSVEAIIDDVVRVKNKELIQRYKNDHN